MYEQLPNCPVCGHDSSTNFIICKDHLATDESFVIVECKKCTFLYTNPRPDETNIHKYYDSSEYISHSNTKKGFINKAYHIVRQKALKSKLALINSYVDKPSSVLDVGCGSGLFLEVCKKVGWNISGVETDSSTRQMTEKSLSISLNPDVFSLTKEKSYDIITLWHVLEHVHKLNETLEFLRARLTKTGRLIIAVPNHDSLDRELYKENWAAYDVPRHLYHFTQKTMKDLIKRHKMKVEKILPMKYDAYYVSMLSEKHATDKSNLLKAYKNGRKSNKYAADHNSNYSSLIYVIKKS